jgi:glycosyltransferase EpsE
MNKSKVSVIMGVYNSANTVGEAIDSIIKQTYHNWELIVCDDGSKDETYSVVNEYVKKYPNIMLIKNDSNRGLTYTLNHCLRYVTGELVARQDGDDISHPERLEKEVKAFCLHPEYSIVSTWYKFFDRDIQWGNVCTPEFPQKKHFLKGSPFVHAASMIKAGALFAVGGYDDRPRTLRVEDYDLWFRMYAKGYIGYNIQETLYYVREDKTSISRKKFSFRLKEMYVRFLGYRMLNLPIWCCIYALRPIVVGMLPRNLYKVIRSIRYTR